MPSMREIAHIARQIQTTALDLGLGPITRSLAKTSAAEDFIALYDHLISCESLRSATRRLYLDGHYARSVEEAYKCLDHAVMVKSKVSLYGVPLIQRVFSENNPVLKINEMRTRSQCDEQAGYMMVLSGCMMGIRNPRAHEYQLWDSPDTALELIILANHLMRIIGQSKRARRLKKSTKTP